jgi:hypothetical protein
MGLMNLFALSAPTYNYSEVMPAKPSGTSPALGFAPYQGEATMLLLSIAMLVIGFCIAVNNFDEFPDD